MMDFNAISFVAGNLKGGVGKSTITGILSSVFASANFGLKVLVVDSDLQNTLYLKRQNEMSEIDELSHKNICDVISLDSSQIFKVIQRKQIEVIEEKEDRKVVNLASDLRMEYHKESGLGQIETQELFHYNGGYLLDNYDMVFFDLPGNLSEGSELKRPYVLADVVLTPMSPTVNDLASTNTFFKFLTQVRKVRAANNYDTLVLSFMNRLKRTKESELLPLALQATKPEWVEFLSEALYDRNSYGNYWTTSEDYFYSSDLKNEKKKDKKEVTKLANKIFSYYENIKKREMEKGKDIVV